MTADARLGTLRELAVALGQATVPAVVAENAATAARSLAHADAAALMLVEGGTLRVVGNAGLSDEYAGAQRVPLDGARALYDRSRTHIVSELAGASDAAAPLHDGLVRMLAVPLRRDGDLVGTLNVYTSDAERTFGPEEIAAAQVVAAMTATAMAGTVQRRPPAEEAALRDHVVESLGEAVVVTWPDGRLAGMNPAARSLFGLQDVPASERELRERLDVRDEKSGELVSASTSSLRRAAQTGVPWSGCYTIRNGQTGSEQVIETVATPVRGPAGEVVAAVMTVHDVTEMREAERRREEFISVVSHELKTPLTPLKALAQLLRSRLRRARQNSVPPDLDSLERNLAVIERQVDRMNGLVNDLLEVSRAGRGTFRVLKAEFDLATTVREMAQRYVDATVEEGRHSFILTVPESLTAFGDQSRIEQVLSNLIGNAVKYSPRGGSVRVSLAERNGEAVIEVTDEGIGVRDEDLDTVGRSPFTRGGGKASTFAGMGIGLYLSRLVAQRHGGKIEVESAGEDRGTTVRVRLPQGLD